jgi:hypothetical protein
VGEDVVEVVLAAVGVAVHAAGDELVEVDLAVLVHVHHLEHAVQLVVGELDALRLQSRLDLVDRQEAVVESVDLLEQLPQLLDLLRGQLRGDERQAHRLQLRVVREVLHLPEVQLQSRLLQRRLLHPGMRQDLVQTDPHLLRHQDPVQQISQRRTQLVVLAVCMERELLRL